MGGGGRAPTVWPRAGAEGASGAREGRGPSPETKPLTTESPTGPPVADYSRTSTRSLTSRPPRPSLPPSHAPARPDPPAGAVRIPDASREGRRASRSRRRARGH